MRHVQALIDAVRAACQQVLFGCPLSDEDRQHLTHLADLAQAQVDAKTQGSDDDQTD